MVRRFGRFVRCSLHYAGKKPQASRSTATDLQILRLEAFYGCDGAQFLRKAKNTSGLIKYQPRGDPTDWTAAAKGNLATEHPDAIVVMLGLDDRVAIREPPTQKSDSTSKDAKAKTKSGRAVNPGCRSAIHRRTEKADRRTRTHRPLNKRLDGRKR
jgi:hypothetical protein